MSKILLLGAGFVTGPLVKYLHEKNHSLTIASQFLAEAQALAAGRANIQAMSIDVSDSELLSAQIAQVDLVISFVPYTLHVQVAKLCIQNKKSLVTASYTHEDMWALNQAAQEAGVTLLNEIGVDPGIDHMTAMQVIDKAHEAGHLVEALVSWCGGIPAPEANNNPLGYKFSWSPMGVLSATLNDAHYLSQGQKVSINAKDLLGSMRDVTLAADLELKGYPNRDSLSYSEQYGIPEVKTLLRGTLRYPGFGSVIDAAKQIGLLSSEKFTPGHMPKDWKSLVMSLTNLAEAELSSRASQSEEANKSLAWLGCFSESAVVGHSPIEAFCHLLQNRLKYEDGEQDMIVMQHRLVLKQADGQKLFHRSTLVEKGEPNGFSAMAKTVGYPAAIAADLILSGTIDRKGVCIPVTKDIYEPVLSELSRLGIEMDEVLVNDQEERDFLNQL